MTAKEYFDLIVKQIRSTVVATVDGDGLPVTCVIDMMYANENGLFFLTAKGKSFYDRIGCGPCLSDCPQSCIELNGKAVIRQENCLHCGNCAEVCPVGAVIRR